MPEIDATPLPHLGLVRVRVDWGLEFDPAVTHVRLERVRADTGAAQALRPHTAYSGEYQRLSEGSQSVILYDPEAPFDTPFYYRATALHEPDVMYGAAFVDTFDRVASSGWGGGWEHNSSGIPGGPGFSVNGADAIDAPEATNLHRYSYTDVGTSDQRVFAVVSLPALPSAGYVSLRVCARVAAVNLTYYHARVDVDATGAATLYLQRRVDGTLVNLAGPVSLGTYTAGADLAIQIEARGGLIRCRAWSYPEAAPAWQAEATDAWIPSGTEAALASYLDPGVTNLPFEIRWRSAYVSRIGDTGGYPTLTLSSEGAPWLRVPLRPYLNRRLTLRPAGAACSPGRGIFFIGVGEEVYRATSASFAAQNASLPYAIARPRLGAEATLTVATRTFADRDELLETLASGTPLLFTAPPVYGVPDRYVDVRDVSVARGRQDHRIPFRVVDLPCVQVEAPRGPAKGPLGARYVDGGEETWGEAAAAGKTYDDLIWVA